MVLLLSGGRTQVHATKLILVNGSRRLISSVFRLKSRRSRLPHQPQRGEQILYVERNRRGWCVAGVGWWDRRALARSPVHLSRPVSADSAKQPKRWSLANSRAPNFFNDLEKGD